MQNETNGDQPAVNIGLPEILIGMLFNVDQATETEQEGETVYVRHVGIAQEENALVAAVPLEAVGKYAIEQYHLSVGQEGPLLVLTIEKAGEVARILGTDGKHMKSEKQSKRVKRLRKELNLDQD